MLNPTDITLASYEDRVDAYFAGSPTSVDPGVASLLDALIQSAPGGSILELGSGPGREADYLEQRGLIVERTDACVGFVEHLRQQGHPTRVLDVRSGELGGPFDAVLANAVLLHLDRVDFERALEACYAATREGGFLVITLKEGDGEAWSMVKIGAPRWFAYWQSEPLREALVRTGWQVLRLERVPGRHEPWLYAVCQRPDRP